MIDSFLERLQAEYGFRPANAEDRELFSEYQQDNCFFDLSFTNFWCWNECFHYTYRMIDENVVVIYRGLQNSVSCILLSKPGHEIEKTVAVLYELFSRERMQLVFEYVPEQWLPLYESLCCVKDISSDRKWSDYIYDTGQFVDLKGTVNKNKRHELAAFSENGGCSFRPLTMENAQDCLKVFQNWCNDHECRDCVFGCERRAFEHFLEIYEPKRYFGGIVYRGDQPLAFAVAEQVGNDCVCYSFQKNSEKIPGLTYFLHYHCALTHLHIPLMNWCEDMGLEGLRQNKLKYHPSKILNKYTIKLKCLQPVFESCKAGAN